MTPFELVQWAIAAALAVLMVGGALAVILACIVGVLRYKPLDK